MQNVKFNIVRLVNPRGTFETGAEILVIKGWHAATLYAAARLAEIASATYGGTWSIAHNGADTVTIWQGYASADFAPRKQAQAPKARKLARRVA